MDFLKKALRISDFGCPLPENCSFHWATAADWDRLALPGEEIFIQKAVLKRQREFRAGRNTARHCFNDLLESKILSKNKRFLLERPIGVGESREPIWPESVVGSISHAQFECHDSHSAQEFCAVVVASQKRIRSIGIDVERVEHLAPDSLDLIVTPNEWRRSKEHCWPRYWPKYLFAVKESFYKCLYPLTGLYLDFLEAEFHLSAIKENPGLYEAHLIAINSKDFELDQSLQSKFKGYVYGDASAIRAAFWLEH